MCKRDVHPRSYIIEHDGYRLRGNRRQLLKTAEDVSPIETPEVAVACGEPPADFVEPNEAPPTPDRPPRRRAENTWACKARRTY